MELLGGLHNRVIFFKHGTEKHTEILATEEMAEMLTGMRQIDVKAYQIDLTITENKEALVEFLQKRGSKFDEKTIMSNSFVLGNRFNDIWF